MQHWYSLYSEASLGGKYITIIKSNLKTINNSYNWLTIIDDVIKSNNFVDIFWYFPKNSLETKKAVIEIITGVT